MMMMMIVFYGRANNKGYIAPRVINLTPSCLYRWGAMKHMYGDLVRSTSKIDLRLRSFGDPGKSC